MNVSIVGLTSFEMDVDFLFDQKVITKIPYDRIKATLQEYKNELIT